MDIGVADNFFKKVEEGKEEVPLPEDTENPHPMDLVREFFMKGDFDELKEKVINALEPGKYEYLMKVCALLVNSADPNF